MFHISLCCCQEFYKINHLHLQSRKLLDFFYFILYQQIKMFMDLEKVLKKEEKLKTKNVEESIPQRGLTSLEWDTFRCLCSPSFVRLHCFLSLRAILS